MMDKILDYIAYVIIALFVLFAIYVTFAVIMADPYLVLFLVLLCVTVWAMERTFR